MPFSDGVFVGDTLYVAGHMRRHPKTGQAPADPEQEARLATDGIKTTVEAAGLSMDEVLSAQVFCTDLKLYERFNAVYKTYLHGHHPARAFIGTDKPSRWKVQSDWDCHQQNRTGIRFLFALKAAFVLLV